VVTGTSGAFLTLGATTNFNEFCGRSSHRTD
jgi:hypothetical protein